MPRNNKKSKTSGTSRLSKLLKKNKKRKSKPNINKNNNNNASEQHLSVNNDPPKIVHRKSSPFMMTSNILNDINISKEESSSSSSTTKSRTASPNPSTSKPHYTHFSSPPLRHIKRSLSHSSYNTQSKLKTLDMTQSNTLKNTPPPIPNVNRRKSSHNVPPPPPKNHNKTKSVQHRLNDPNINIKIDIKNDNNSVTRRRGSSHGHSRHQKDRRSRHNSIDTPTSPRTPQSPINIAQFISHIPRTNIESKINMKQLLCEMIEMKRQIKALKKDMKYLKTENDLCHRRITILEQTIESNKKDNNGIQVPTYPIYQPYHYIYPPPAPAHAPQSISTNDQTHTNRIAMPQIKQFGPTHTPKQSKPPRLSLSNKPGDKVSLSTSFGSGSRSGSTDNGEDDDDIDIEERLTKLSRKMSVTNVFSNEYRRLEYELQQIIMQQQQHQDEQQNNDNTYYYDKQSKYNPDTMVIKNKNKKGSKRLYSTSTYYCSDSDDMKDIDLNDNVSSIKSICTLSRRKTKKKSLTNLVQKQKRNKNKSFDIVDDDLNNMDHKKKLSHKKHHKKNSTLGEGMELID